MTLHEVTGRRDVEQLYSEWHRPNSIRRFLPPGVDPDSLGLVNIDHIVRCERWSEYCRTCCRTLALIESALGAHQTHKTAKVTQQLALELKREAFIVLVVPAADGEDIESFRVRRIAPSVSPWRDFTPREWALKLVEIRQRADRCSDCPDHRAAEAA